MSLPEITIATSIPPQMVRIQNGEDIGRRYQDDCVASWLGSGFRVISINTPQEISALASRYPDVEFVPAERDAEAVLRRKAPLISELLRALSSQARQIVGIINADICLEAGRDWRGTIEKQVSSSLLIAKRVDIEGWPERSGEAIIAGTRNPDGFDLFFFEKSAISDWLVSAANSPYFGLGVPWWDFWFPVVMAFGGYRVQVLKDPVGAHLLHPTNYEHRLWELMAAHLIDFVSRPRPENFAGYAPELKEMVEWAERLRAKAISELILWTENREREDKCRAEQERFRIEIALFSRIVLGTLSSGVVNKGLPSADEVILPSFSDYLSENERCPT